MKKANHSQSQTSPIAPSLLQTLSVQGVLRWALRVLARSDLTRMAAALAYRTVFGIIPVLAIGVAMLGGFASDTQVEETVREVLAFTGLGEIVVDQQAAAAHSKALHASDERNQNNNQSANTNADADTNAAPAVQSQSLDGEANSAARLDEWLANLVREVRKVSFVAIGLTGLLTLAYAAISFVIEIERSANHIYRAPSGRSWVRRITQYWTTLTLGSLFLIGTFYVGKHLTDALTNLGGIVSDESNFGAQAAGIAVSALIGFLLLLFMYMTIPNTRVSLRCAATGAAFSAVLWEAGKWGFTYFVAFSKASMLYGALALVPLFLLWVYITWLIVLFGLQISYVLQNYTTLVAAEEDTRGPMLVDTLTVVRVAIAVGKRFVQGTVATISDIARDVGLDDRTTLAMLEKLLSAGVVHRVPAGEDVDGFSLAKPAEQVRVADLIELAGHMAPGPGGTTRMPDPLAAIGQAQICAAGEMTLGVLIDARDDEATDSSDDRSKT